MPIASRPLIGSCLFLIFILSTISFANETDQFYASRAIIKDASIELNTFILDKMEIALDVSNHQKETVNCRMVAAEVMTQLLGHFSIRQIIKDKDFSKISYFTQNSPLIERFPNETVSGQEYRAQSIYKNRPFPINVVGLGRTINVNGIHMGTDKIGHIAIVGRTYYKHFREELEKGLSFDQAEINAIWAGIKEEIGILGYDIGGAFSYADLEANYQGLKFARNMCEGINPHLIQVNRQWKLNPVNLFDIKNYTNPKMDESFNVSLWSPRLWRKMKDDILKSFCKNKLDRENALKIKSYLKNSVWTVNDQILTKFESENAAFDRSKQLLDKNIKCEK